MNEQRLMGISSALKGLKTRMERMEAQHKEIQNTLHRTEQALVTLTEKLKQMDVTIKFSPEAEGKLIDQIIEELMARAQAEGIKLTG